MHGDIRGDRGGRQGLRHGPPLGHGGRSIQVEVGRSGVTAAARPLCHVIFGAHDGETANGGGSGHGFDLNVLGAVSSRVWRGSGAAPAPLLHISPVGHFRRNGDYLSAKTRCQSLFLEQHIPSFGICCSSFQLFVRYLKSTSCSRAGGRMGHMSSRQGRCKNTNTVAFGV